MRVGVVGATGYAGSEVVRLLAGRVELRLFSDSRAGVPFAEAVPALAGFVDAELRPVEPAALSALDAVVLATPHGVARTLAPRLDSPVIVDLSADHRHAPGWAYGMVEWRAEALRGAPRIAVPGCFATAIALSLAPLVAEGLARGPALVQAMTGSTGAGASPKSATHHPLRFANVRAYKVLAHQHVPEIRAFLAGLGDAPPLHFVPVSAPLDRGIFATTFVETAGDPAPAFARAYGTSRFVRLRADTPEVRHVRGTALADLAVHRAGDHAVVLAAIDNLGMGAAGQAVRCLELATGLPPAPPVPPCTP